MARRKPGRTYIADPRRAGSGRYDPVLPLPVPNRWRGGIRGAAAYRPAARRTEGRFQNRAGGGGFAGIRPDLPADEPAGDPSNDRGDHPGSRALFVGRTGGGGSLAGAARRARVPGRYRLARQSVTAGGSWPL